MSDDLDRNNSSGGTTSATQDTASAASDRDAALKLAADHEAEAADAKARADAAEREKRYLQDKLAAAMSAIDRLQASIESLTAQKVPLTGAASSPPGGASPSPAILPPLDVPATVASPDASADDRLAHLEATVQRWAPIMDELWQHAPTMLRQGVTIGDTIKAVANKLLGVQWS